MGFNDGSNAVSLKAEDAGLKNRLRKFTAPFAMTVTMALAACSGSPETQAQAPEKSVVPVALDVKGRIGEEFQLTLPNGVTFQSEDSALIDPVNPTTFRFLSEVTGDTRIIVSGKDDSGKLVDIELDLSVLPSFTTAVTADVSKNQASGSFKPNLPVTNVEWGTMPQGFTQTPLVNNGGSYNFVLQFTSAVAEGEHQVPVTLTRADGKKSTSFIEVSVDRKAPSLLSKGKNLGTPDTFAPVKYDVTFTFNEPIKNATAVINVLHQNGAFGAVDSEGITVTINGNKVQVVSTGIQYTGLHEVNLTVEDFSGNTSLAKESELQIM